MKNPLFRIHLENCFVTRSSEKSVVKAGGEKGSDFAREGTLTMIFLNTLAKFITLKGLLPKYTN